VDVSIREHHERIFLLTGCGQADGGELVGRGNRRSWIRQMHLTPRCASRSKKLRFAARSRLLDAPRALRNPGVRSSQQREEIFAMDQPAELDRLGDEIAELSAHLDAATARLLDLIREFDARGGWSNGFRSCAEWLSWRVGLAPGAAREKVRVARALGALPLLARALASGEVSYSKIREVTRV